jgi:quercetin dioxygenase-like cupin family protein
MSLAYVAQAAEHQQLEWLGGAPMSVLLDGAATGGQLAMMRSHLPAGSAAPVHSHAAVDELFVILHGEGLFWYGDDRYEVGEGGVVFLPRGVPHTYLMTADTDLLTICTPAGAEGFFRGVGRDLAVPKPSGWAITPESLAAMAPQFGIEILGPPRSA